MTVKPSHIWVSPKLIAQHHLTLSECKAIRRGSSLSAVLTRRRRTAVPLHEERDSAEDLRGAVLVAREKSLRHPTFIGLETLDDRFHWVRLDAIKAIGCPRRVQEIHTDMKDEEDEDDVVLPARVVTTRTLFLQHMTGDKTPSTLTILDTRENLTRLGFTFVKGDTTDGD